MTKKDFIKIAGTLRTACDKLNDPDYCFNSYDIVDLFSEMLEKDSPNFDRIKFEEAVFGRDK